MYAGNKCGRLLAQVLILILTSGLYSMAFADAKFSIPSRAEARKVNENKIGVVFTHEELFHQLVHNMEHELEHDSGLRIVPIMGKNHVQSVVDLLFLNGVDLALVRADAIEYVRRHGDTPNIKRVVNSVAKVSEEKIMVIARKDYKTLAELDGQVVGVGLPGSGEYVTGSIAFETLNIKPNRIAVNNVTALEKLRTGELAAMVYLLRAPDAPQLGDDRKAADAILNLQLGDELHILEIPESDALSQIYTPDSLSSLDLPGVIDENELIATYSVDAVLAVYKWSSRNKRRKQTQRFVKALVDGIEGLQTDRHQPAWKRVDLAESTPNVTSSALVKTALEAKAVEQARLAEAQKELNAKLSSEEKFEQLIIERNNLENIIGAELSQADADELKRLLEELNTFLKQREPQ